MASLAAISWQVISTRTPELTQADVDQAVEEALAAAGDPTTATRVFDTIAPSLVVVRVDWSDTDRAGQGDADQDSTTQGSTPRGGEDQGDTDEGSTPRGGADQGSGGQGGADRGGSDQRGAATIGAGVIINSNGQIITANHLVAEATSIQVVFADGTESRATVATSEPDMDIAVLETARSPSVIVPAVLGNSRTLRIGDDVFVVGNPLGLAASLSTGVISGLGRNIPVTDAGATLERLIQFDAAVNQGNSGGPLLNSDGQVVGIVTALADPSAQGFFVGIGFAVPIDMAAGRAANGPSQ